MASNKEHFYVNRKARAHFHLTDPDFLSLPPAGPEAMKRSERQAALFNDYIRREQGEQAREVLPAQLHGMKLLHEVFHYIIGRALRSREPRMLDNAWQRFSRELDETRSAQTLTRVLTAFPTQRIWCGFETPAEWSAHEANRNEALEESFLIWLNTNNPALDQFSGLINDPLLTEEESWRKLIAAIQGSMQSAGPIGPGGEDLAELLTKPIRHAPASILEQLRYIRRNWGELVEDSPFWEHLDRAIDYIQDEDNYLFFERVAREGERSHAGSWFEKEAHVPTYSDDGPANYTTDSGWMPEVVMLAKSTYVWLDQLSKQYGRPVHRLQDIPDEELDRIAERGFTSLWLIGLWERSYASEKIKQLQGNPEAKASAYALESYDIARELGGYEGYRNLRDRARSRGIRLASDMVPNHTGMDSELVRERPDWFLSTNEPPYWNYSYTGPNLSSHPDYGIWLEDGYWNRSDAAVSFKRTDFRSGDTRYIYHGNDGTNMPWNDTAQLNFLSPEVREGVIQQILHVARMFPVIRFDAAMVLAKRHIQRLWFPLHGHQAAVPSRSSHSMSMADFDAAIPEEFWREVVERIKRELPDTLLLAEAFWMLEGYFVRTLGMHRVYNSAFMHMLKKEDNASYRYLIKNTLEFDPEILKRYVNFMNNPDEDTAIAQFGNGDKYFGVCMLMATMPGLPMFGHGQVEGFTEKYGMEYAKAYYDEQPDEGLLGRHYHEIFPVLKKRPLFAEVANFYLYDAYGPHGTVDENIFAYSNRRESQRALMVYNNRYEQATAWVRTSVGYLREGGIRQSSLVEGLGLDEGGATHVIFRDHKSGLEFIRPVDRLREEGLHVALGGYQYNLFLDFRLVTPSRLRPWDRLEKRLAGSGCHSIEREVLKLSLAPLHGLLASGLDAKKLEKLATTAPASFAKPAAELLASAVAEWASLMERPLEVPDGLDRAITERVERALQLTSHQHLLPEPETAHVAGDPVVQYALQWIVLDQLRELTDPEQNPVDLLLLEELLVTLQPDAAQLGLTAEKLGAMTACLLEPSGNEQHGLQGTTALKAAISAMDRPGKRHLEQALQIEHRHDKRWFRSHPFDMLVTWIILRRLIITGEETTPDTWHETIEQLDMEAYLAGYELGALLRESGQEGM